MIYILIQAGEGKTEAVLVSRSKEELLKEIEQEIQEDIDNRPEMDALGRMIENHIDWVPGRYILENIEPIWQDWTLIINKGGTSNERRT
jgi:hypothetical protein